MLMTEKTVSFRNLLIVWMHLHTDWMVPLRPVTLGPSETKIVSVVLPDGPAENESSESLYFTPSDALWYHKCSVPEGPVDPLPTIEIKMQTAAMNM